MDYILIQINTIRYSDKMEASVVVLSRLLAITFGGAEKLCGAKQYGSWKLIKKKQ